MFHIPDVRIAGVIIKRVGEAAYVFVGDVLGFLKRRASNSLGYAIAVNWAYLSCTNQKVPWYYHCLDMTPWSLVIYLEYHVQ